MAWIHVGSSPPRSTAPAPSSPPPPRGSRASARRQRRGHPGTWNRNGPRRGFFEAFGKAFLVFVFDFPFFLGGGWEKECRFVFFLESPF